MRTAEVVEALRNNEIFTDHGLNQEMDLKRPRNTRWSFDYGAIVNLIQVLSSIIDVIEDIVEDGLYSKHRAKENTLIQSL
jgi:hypothetical protein